MVSAPKPATHRRAILFVVALLAAGGAAVVFRLPVSLFPRTNFPRIMVSADAGDRPADRMVVEVTRPLEEAIRNVPGIKSVRSLTTRGTCDISATFRWGLDMFAATLQVESAVNRILPALPPGLSFEVRRMDPTVFPVIGLSLTSMAASLVSLRDLALYDLRPLLSTIDGVAKIEVLGGRTQEYQVVVDPARAEAVGLSLEDVVGAVSAANVIEAVGRLEENEKLYLLLSDTRIRRIGDLANIVVRRGPSGVVLLSDVAAIEDSVRPEWTRVTAKGRDAVILNIYQQPDGNTARISDDARARIEEFRLRGGAGLDVGVWYDQTQLITATARSVRDAILIGIALAVVVLLLFLRNWRVTLAVCFAVPAVLAITCLVLAALDMGINIMTLGGMAAAVGLIADDGIVMVEHILRRLREEPARRAAVVLEAAREMAVPLAASSLATVIIFAPLAYLTGVAGAFFKALSVTMAAALAVSFLVAYFAVPLVADAFLGAKDAAVRDVGPVLSRVLAMYDRTLRVFLRRPVLVLLGILPLLALGWVSYREVGTGFMPSMDEGGFILDYRAPAGTSLAETDRRLRVLETILSRTRDVETWSRRTGLGLGGGINEANEGDFFVRLRSMPRRPIDEVMEEVRGKIEAEVPGLEVELLQLMEDLIGDLTAVPQPIEIKLFGGAEEVLRGEAPRVAEAIRKVAGVVDVKSGVVLAGDAVEIHVDRLKAEMLGLDPERVTRLVRIALGGEVTTEVQSGEKMVGIRTWIASGDRSRLDQVRRLRLRAPGGAGVPLGRVATFTVAAGQPQITRENLKGMVAVTGRISGTDMGSAIRDVKAALGGLRLPPGVYAEFGGLYRQQQESFRGLLAVLAAAVGLVFILLVFLYESFSAPLAILAVDLLAAAAVFPGLWWTGSELDISSMMGLTMIVGISSEVGIFFMTQWKESSARSDFTGALSEAGRLRFRPIVMTSLAAVLALLPLALAVGEGAEMLRPLAIAIISGLVATVPLVLLVLPVLFSVFSFGRNR
jgi:multidrug efflux pump subunit AcrB